MPDQNLPKNDEVADFSNIGAEGRTQPSSSPDQPAAPSISTSPVKTIYLVIAVGVLVLFLVFMIYRTLFAQPSPPSLPPRLNTPAIIQK